jgi:DnaD/phage-associated family protein
MIFFRGMNMNTVDLSIEKVDMQKLLGAANPDAALLYLYLRSGNDPDRAGESLRLSETRILSAGALLRQLGLWQETRKGFIAGERPAYSEQDVVQARNSDREFCALYGEIENLLGRTLNTEEMKIVLGFVRYLGLPAEVVCVLICYCKERARQRGSLRNPSLRSIEKEAYIWAEQGIDTMEEAAAYMQAQNLRNSQLGKLMQTLQIRGRSLTPGEEKYARQWLEAGFDMDAIAMAYERTCLNTGGMNWAYMNKILTRWQENGLLTVEQVKNGDKKPKTKSKSVNPSGKLGEAELENIRRIMQEV